MKFILPIPTSVNAMYGTTMNKKTGKSRMYKKQAALDWEDEAMKEIMVQRVGQPRPKGDTIYVTFYRKDKRRWDSNNAIKILYDVLQKKQIVLDDSDIVFEQIQKKQLHGMVGVASYCEVEVL